MEMSQDKLYARLKTHANLPSPDSFEQSFCLLVYKSRIEKRPIDLTFAASDVFRCFRALNRIWNGTTPSLTPKERFIGSLDRWIVYYVSVVINDAIEYAAMLASCFGSTVAETVYAWQIACAMSVMWNSVLAGDIDDLDETVRLELESRFPGESVDRIRETMSGESEKGLC